jgi:hypothetical protein
VQVESLGGDVIDVEVSATKKLNLDRLLELIGLQAEILELKVNPTRPAEGTVIEAKLDRGRGPVATVLVQRGTLRVGDIIVAGAEWGRVRALISDTGAQVDEARPSTPVEVLGFNGTPEASDRLAVVDSEARAREVSDYRARQKRGRPARGDEARPLEQMISSPRHGPQGPHWRSWPTCGARRRSRRAGQTRHWELGPGSLARRRRHRDPTDASRRAPRHAQRARPWEAASVRHTGIEIRYYNIIAPGGRREKGVSACWRRYPRPCSAMR